MLYWIKLIFFQFQFQFRMGLLQGRNCINLTKKIEPKMNNVEQIARFTKRIKPKSSCRCCSRKHADAVFCLCSYINKLEVYSTFLLYIFLFKSTFSIIKINTRHRITIRWSSKIIICFLAMPPKEYSGNKRLQVVQQLRSGTLDFIQSSIFYSPDS